MSLGIATVAPEATRDPVLLGWQEQIRTARAEARSLRIVGADSKAFYGRPVDGEALSTLAYRGVVAYEPTELVITARAGTPLAEVEAALAERGQMLAFEPPHFAGAPTIGGVVAAGLSGPRRMAVGAVRDFVLGVRLLDGKGDLLRFGGQVMKNVAGYDVSRLLAGSLGCLGVLAELSLKVVPLPRQERSLRFELPAGQALDRLHRWAGRPLPISASAWHDGALHVRLSGAEAAVAAAHDKLGGEAMTPADASALWTGLRDQTLPFFAPASPAMADPDPLPEPGRPNGAGADGGSRPLRDATTGGGDARALFRLALPDTTPELALPAAQLIEWGGAQRWCLAPLADSQKIRSIATSCGGHATLFRAPGGGRSAEQVFTPLALPLLRIHQQLKRAFDPAGVFNRGRLYPEF